ncbi:glycerate kinase family protein [Catellatospora citrea]|uniref:Glycerate kinase n=1 Tax=Catellatospora citrea TaxID=53366 RepID=A0A8J3NWQ9_9ACTN|nr:glycerate kinase [Catellatospora citrea]RKE07214.1 glycerate kinase [Catellatospora citrea]GIF95367.1 glycerate kinase [Catellatospora citrea]
MRVLICPDKFAGTLTAVEAAQAVAAGWREVAASDELICRPIADGGPGFVEVLHASIGGELVEVDTTDPLGRAVLGAVLLAGDAAATAYVESAQACGLHLVEPGERDPKVTSSYGLGALIEAAVARGARRVVIGLGGSATNDGGAGLLAALGAVGLDAAGEPLAPGGAALTACTSLALAHSAPDSADATGSDDATSTDGATSVARVAGSGLLPAGVELIAATDVDNPLTGLHGASAVYGPQKGATPQDVTLLDAALANWAAVLERELPGCPAKLSELPGGGAAGGLGAAILALGGTVASGIDLIRELTGLDQVLESVDLLITGEGSFDHQSLRGKAISGLAGAARDLGIPCVVLAGRVTTGRREQGAAGVTEAYALVDHFGSVDLALAEPTRGLRELASRLARQWSR